jgi:hypothetical protein
MSWEGYYQQLCKKGHYTSKSAEYQEEDEQCRICGEKIVWVNTVDTTNGSFDDEGNQIDGYIELEEKERKVCEHCKSILEILYKIPKGKGYKR